RFLPWTAVWLILGVFAPALAMARARWSSASRWSAAAILSWLLYALALPFVAWVSPSWRTPAAFFPAIVIAGGLGLDESLGLLDWTGERFVAAKFRTAFSTTVSALVCLAFIGPLRIEAVSEREDIEVWNAVSASLDTQLGDEPVMTDFPWTVIAATG